MWWSNSSVVIFGYRKLQSYLPTILVDAIRGMMYSKTFSEKHTEELLRIGKTVGLERTEIIAATSIPIDSIRHMERSRATFFGLFVAVFVIICIILGLSILYVGGQSGLPETPTYAPGTKYGSISPQDFTFDSNTRFK